MVALKANKAAQKRNNDVTEQKGRAKTKRAAQTTQNGSVENNNGGAKTKRRR